MELLVGPWIPKFARERAAKCCELRNRTTRRSGGGMSLFMAWRLLA